MAKARQYYETGIQEAKRGVSYAYDKASTVNFMTLIKVIAVILTIVIAFFSFKKIKSFFGFGESDESSAGLLGGLFGSKPDKPTAGTTHANVDTNPNSWLNQNSGKDTSGKAKIPLKVANLVDEIHDELDGWTFYPTEYKRNKVNQIANLTLSELKHTAHYWGDKYKASTGKNLYQFLSSEWSGFGGGFFGDGSHPYAPALAALKKTGYYGK